MGMHSVSCWRLSDKEDTPFASGCLPVDSPFSSRVVFILPLHHDDNRIRPPWRLTIPPVASVKPDNPFLGRKVGRSHLERLPFLTPVTSILLLTEALTFGRRGAHFRENCVRISANIQVDIQVKRVRNLTFAAIILSADRGAHFREKECSLSGEGVLTFGRRGAHFREKSMRKTYSISIRFGL
jgi:hypothetical protein